MALPCANPYCGRDAHEPESCDPIEHFGAFREYRGARPELCIEEAYRNWHMLLGHNALVAAYVKQFGIVCGCTKKGEAA